MKAVLIICIVLMCTSTLRTQEVEENSAPCVIDGVTYASGDLTPDPCNRCKCDNGLEVCSLVECRQEDLNSCVIDGVTYANGALTPDPCNRCRCYNGLEACNLMECPQGTI
uniref:VWFC domain-containing protein n=1 Tax=Biomphalaria glabrata TaxID=6526 RepID=A0A2C9L3Z7_BIOGL